MRIIAIKRIRQFWEIHPKMEQPLRHWVEVARKASWCNLHEIRDDFPTADGVPVKSGRIVIVFNIGGNKFRLVAGVNYDTQIVYIKYFLSHAEYDTNQWKRSL